MSQSERRRALAKLADFGFRAFMAFLQIVDYIALFYLLLLLWIPCFWFLFHPGIDFWRRLGKRAFWVALPVWLSFAVALIAARHEIFAERLPRNPLTWAAGIALFAVASWLEVRTRHSFGWRRLVGLTELNQKHPLCGVVSTGIYGRVRHPRYLLYMLMPFSMALLTGSVAIFLLAFLNVLMYQILTPLEERELMAQYGLQYESYKKSVPRFVPRFGRRPAIRRSS